ncbi:MAG: SUMF1/EgtB/PvdO family nonheme iron enzyme, partial [Chloroflexi bacterium]|nr:SUMF1/EgtB/PvdO family nonheme iron enzyme [Chloroflexota bacterium]
PADGRERLDGPSRRVVRGGSWNFNRRFARAAFRHWDVPSFFYFNIGFRVVYSLAKWG